VWDCLTDMGLWVSLSLYGGDSDIFAEEEREESTCGNAKMSSDPVGEGGTIWRPGSTNHLRGVGGS
jgi:hypothetical protein